MYRWVLSVCTQLTSACTCWSVFAGPTEDKNILVEEFLLLMANEEKGEGERERDSNDDDDSTRCRP